MNSLTKAMPMSAHLPSNRVSTHALALVPAMCLALVACFPTAGLDDAEDEELRQATCQQYCVEVTEACTGNDAQFPNLGICETHCQEWAAWPIGPEGNREFNDIQCRLSHAISAANGESVAANCVRAGPTGGNACGTYCTNYCDLLAKNCADHPEVLLERSECLRQCAELDATGEPTASSGDTVQCRIHHLTLAAHSPPRTNEVHCPHGGIVPTAMCVDE